MAACLPAPPTPFPTETPTATLSPTATIVWFPPTRTPTPFPTILPTPTPDLRPGLGETLLEDDFNSGAAWSLAFSDVGGVAVAHNRLTLALTQAEGYLFTTRQEPVFTDFYAEITASPSLCAGADEYGLLVRANSSQDYYRFSLSCDGRAQVIRLRDGTPGSIVPWTPSGAIPSAVPASSRLGVWALGGDVRFFIDDFYLFSIHDTVFYSGTLGVFARAAGETAVTVSFSNLVVRQVSAGEAEGSSQ